MTNAHSVGVDCLGLIGDLDLDDKKIAVIHGDDRKLLRKLLDEQQYDYLFCGHDPGGDPMERVTLGHRSCARGRAGPSRSRREAWSSRGRA